MISRKRGLFGVLALLVAVLALVAAGCGGDDDEAGDGGTNTEATGDNFQVFLKPKCDPAVVAFAPNQWRLERGQMILMSAAGQTWQFEADDNAQWRRVPDTADPLIMIRGQ